MAKMLLVKVISLIYLDLYPIFLEQRNKNIIDSSGSIVKVSLVK